MIETNRIVFVFVAQYLLRFSERLHHALIQRQFVFVGRRLNKLRGVVLDVPKQYANLIVLHRDSAPGPRDLRQPRRLTLMRLLNQFLLQVRQFPTNLTLSLPDLWLPVPR